MDATGHDSISPRWWFVPLAFVLAGLVLLPIDVSVSSYFHGQRSRTIDEFWEICETFGHGIGASFIVIAAVVIDPVGWRNLTGLLVGSLGSGLVADLLKLCIHRTRPRDIDLTTCTVWDTFIRSGTASKSMHSIPSSHTATAVGLAIVLSALYPRGRYLFGVLAILVGMQRIVTQAHFPSDVCAGAAVGSAVGLFIATTAGKRNKPDAAH